MPRASGAIVFAVAISPGTSAQVVEFMMVVVSVLVRCTLSPTIDHANQISIKPSRAVIISVSKNTNPFTKE